MTQAMQKLFGRSHAGGSGDEAHWLSVSDLMAGLMMVFLFIAITLMRDAIIERDRMKEVAVTYQENQRAIYNALVDEFEQDLPRWDASIDSETLSFDFQSPDVLFESGESDIQPQFRSILSDFFPRYLEVLDGYRESIDEVRIEGHTSSLWQGAESETEAYFKNMDLSQRRTRSVLNFVYTLDEISSYQDWVKRHFAAVGFSSARPVLTDAGSEDMDRSRRVSFRVITNAEVQIRQILDGE